MKKKGFTLIEIMVTIAIIAVLAGVMLVKVAGYGKDARASKALSGISSAIPSMVSCWAFGGNVTLPGNYGNICDAGSSYGQWPSPTGDLSNYQLSSNSASGYLPKSGWVISFTNSADNLGVCCNSVMNGCKILPFAGPSWTPGVCDANNPSN